jgi:hypothetical protein
MPSAVLCNTVFIGIDHIRLLFLYPLCHLPQGIGAEQVIMVAEGYVFTAGILYRFIGVSADTLVFFSADYPETGSVLLRPSRIRRVSARVPALYRIASKF